MTIRRGWNPLTLAALVAAWMAALPNWPLWQALWALPEVASTTRGLVFIGGFGAAIAALLFILMAPFAWRWTIRPIATLLLLAAAFGAYFMHAYNVVIDTPMITNVLQTDPREVRDLLNARLALSVLVLAGLPLILVWRLPLARVGMVGQFGRNLVGMVVATLVVAALVFALFADLSATMRNHPSARYLINPMNSLYALVDLGMRSGVQPAGPPRPIGLDARVAPRAAQAKPPLVVFVVGETARADHFMLNGYARPTTPELAALGDAVLSWRQVTSCGTSTAASLPCMFSPLGREGYNTSDGHDENLLDLVQRAGLAVMWVDNQSGCKGLCDRVPHVETCNSEDCMDDTLPAGLDERLAALPAAARERGVLLVLHQMGSHGPAYSKRSPPSRKPFLPECTTNVLQQCAHDELVNAYDNSIVTTDHMLAQTIRWLDAQRANYAPALLYVSDHGESLGENNLYLHGLPYAVAPIEQKHVPMLLWPASGAGVDNAACLHGLRDVPLSHDNLFHTLLGLLGVSAKEYVSRLDALAACRTPSSAADASAPRQ